MGDVETRYAMSDSVADLTDEQERKIARVEKQIRNSDYGAPSAEWIKKSKARPTPADIVRFRKSDRTMRIGHRYEREGCHVEDRWVVIQSLWMIPRMGVVAWVCFPLNRSRKHRHTWMFAGDFVDAEFSSDGDQADSSP
jgi:hypothetical protein